MLGGGADVGRVQGSCVTVPLRLRTPSLSEVGCPEWCTGSPGGTAGLTSYSRAADHLVLAVDWNMGSESRVANG